MNNKKISLLIRYVSNVTIIAITVFYAYHNWEDLSIILAVDWLILIFLAVLLLLTTLMSSTQFVILYRSLGAKMSIAESFGLSQITI